MIPMKTKMSHSTASEPTTTMTARGDRPAVVAVFLLDRAATERDVKRDGDEEDE